MEAITIHRAYVWELPVRIYHWINAACVAVLVVTGLFIGRPLALQVGGRRMPVIGLEQPVSSIFWRRSFSFSTSWSGSIGGLWGMNTPD